tara:strand:- start:12363 stop:12716 length:354 start_codon:yes stop_codon:yes gene_type:complete
MARFDLTTMGAMLGSAAAGIMNSSFGIPESLLGMSASDLDSLPAEILQEILEQIQSALDKVDETEKDVVKKYMLETGILEYDTEYGKFQYLSDNSKYGLDRNEGQTINNLKALAGVD